MFWLVALFLVKGGEMGEENLGHGATEGYGGLGGPIMGQGKRVSF